MSPRSDGRLATTLRGPVARSQQAAVTGQLLLLLSGPLIARALQPEKRGELALWTLAFVAMAQLGGVGLPPAIGYFAALAGPGAIRMGRGLRLYALWLIVSSGCITAALVMAMEASDRLKPSILFLVLATVGPGLSIWQQIQVSLLQGRQAFGAMNIVRILPAAFYSVFAILFSQLPRHWHQPSIAALGYVSALALSAAIGRFLLSRGGITSPTGNELPLNAVKRYGRRGAIGAANPLDSLSVDQMLVGVLFDNRGLGLYAAASSFSNLSTFVLSSLGMVMSPRLTATRGERGPLIARTLILGVIATIAITVVVELGLPVVLPLMFGAGYQGSLEIAYILVLGGALTALRRLLSAVLFGLEAPALVSVSEAISLGTLALAMYLLTPWLGLRGAALGVVLAGLVAVLISAVGVVRYVSRERKHRSFVHLDPLPKH